MSLEPELETYSKMLDSWSDHVGEFVLIRGEQVVGFYSSYRDAVTVGYDKFGLDPFLVKQISILERSHFVPTLMRASDGIFHETV